PEGLFAQNDVGFIDPTGVDHDTLGLALKKALYNYMHGHLLEEVVRVWFSEFLDRVPKPTVGRQRIAKALARPH
ncbi:MAG: radical SAM protein, partial [Betaproteobacteria bacterium]